MNGGGAPALVISRVCDIVGPTSIQESGNMDITDKIQICKVIAQAIMADIQITDAEREFIDKLMDRYELDEAQRKDVLNRNLDDNVTDMAKGIEALDSQNELLTELINAIEVDGEVAKSEKKLVLKVGLAMGMSEDEVNLLLED
jgi:uncharacterized tellurite resistance protein B-like protein